jgi:hypothetical protein
LRRPATVALLRSIESRTTRSDRIGVPRINVAVNVVHRAPTRLGHRLGAPPVRMVTPGQHSDEQRPDRLVRRPGADARRQRWPAAHPRSSLVVGAAPVKLGASAAGTLRRRGDHRGLINAPAARTIALSVPAPQVASRRLSVAEVRSADGDRQLRDTDAERAPAAPLDLERLTDKVVAAIDRRLWSHRERMGGR